MRTAVCPAPQAQPVPQARVASQVAPDPPEHPDSPACSQGKSADTSTQFASHAHQAHPVHLDHPVWMGTPEATDHPVRQAMEELQALSDQPDHQAKEAHLAGTERRDRPDPMPKALHPNLVTPAPLVRRGHLALLADLVNQELMADPAHPDQRDHPAHPVSLVKMEALVRRDHLGPMAMLESAVFARSTALLMAACSSRMEPDDRYPIWFFLVWTINAYQRRSKEFQFAF